MQLTPQQGRAAHADGRVVVTAGAGTGKTQTMTARYLTLVTKKGLSPLEIVAVTFTNQAANELRSRVSAALARTHHTTARIEAAAAPILTLHALSEQIAREFPLEAGVPPEFRILDERDARQLRDAELPYLVPTLAPALLEAVDYEDLIGWVEHALGDLDRFERAAAVPIDVVRAHLDEAHRAVLADPWWRAAGRELRSRPGPSGDRLEEQRLAAISALERLEEDPEGAFGTLAELKINCGARSRWGESELAAMKELIKEVRERVQALPSWQRYGFSAADEEGARTVALFVEGVRALADALGRIKRARGLVDFQDLELAARRALGHQHVREELHRRVRAILVDEAQDLSPIEHEILDALSSEETHVTFVGDAKQSLYGFRGAAPELFARVAGDTETHVVLDTNFRSTPSLIRCTNAVFAKLLEEQESLHPERTELPRGSRIELLVGDERFGAHASAQRATLAARIATRLAALLDGGTEIYDPEADRLRPGEPRDVAVVSVSWSMLEVVSEALATAGIPARVARGGDLLASQAAADALAMLAPCVDPYDDAAMVALLRSPMLDVSDAELASIRQGTDVFDDHPSWFERLRRSYAAPGSPAQGALARLLDLPLGRVGLPADAILLDAAAALGYTSLIEQLPNAERRLADWHGMIEVISELAAEGMDASAIVELLRRKLIDPRGSGARPPIESGQAVSLLTIHAAKGLEWPIVVAVDLERTSPNPPRLLLDPELGIAFKPEEGCAPHYDLLAAKEQARDEQERVRRWYVALTRARDHLLVALTKESTEVSPLVAALEPHCVGLESTAGSSPRRTERRPHETVAVEPLGTPVVHSFVLSALQRCRFEAWLCRDEADGPAERPPAVGAALGLAPDQGLEAVQPLVGRQVVAGTTIGFGPVLVDDDRVIGLAKPAPDPVGLALARGTREAASAWLLSSEEGLVAVTPPTLAEIAALIAELPTTAPELATTPRGACATCWLAARCPAGAPTADA